MKSLPFGRSGRHRFTDEVGDVAGSIAGRHWIVPSVLRRLAIPSADGAASGFDAAANDGGHFVVGESGEVVVRNGKALLVGEGGERSG